MKTEIQPCESNRAEACRLWMNSPMPMVTVVKTFDVTRLLRFSRRSGMKFTALICWCIGKAASEIPEFYTLPEQGRLFRYDRLAINAIVRNNKGALNFCDIPFSEDLQQFHHDYLLQTAKAAAECVTLSLEGYMLIGTSAVVQTELDCIVNQYSGIFNNPFLSWGRYRKGLFKTTLPISFQFHHVQMDGGHAACFLERLQKEFSAL